LNEIAVNFFPRPGSLFAVDFLLSGSSNQLNSHFLLGLLFDFLVLFAFDHLVEIQLLKQRRVNGIGSDLKSWEALIVQRR
jgi:hypothetical protein